MTEAGDGKRGSAFAERIGGPHRKTYAECLSHGRRFQNHRTQARPRRSEGPDTHDNVWHRWQDHPGGNAPPVRPRKTAPATDKPGSASAPLAIKARICFGSGSCFPLVFSPETALCRAGAAPSTGFHLPPVKIHHERPYQLTPAVHRLRERSFYRSRGSQRSR